MVFEEGSEIEAGAFLDPKIEVELAFILKGPLFGPDVSVTDVLNATDYVVPALELIAARTYRVHPETGYVRTVKDTISDNAANAGIILGGRPVKPDAIDLRWVGALLSKNGVIEESGLAAAVLNHPAKGIAWLARKYAQHGIGLEAGQIILAGSFTRPVSVQSGDTISVEYSDLGTVACYFK
jgi:2-oxo-hept-3-ene-1,7-dioate hydratase